MIIRDLYEYGGSSTSRLETVSDPLQKSARLTLRCSPVDIAVPWMGGIRTATEQNSIFKEGHSKADGYEVLSYHQKTDSQGKGLALDLVPYIHSVGISYQAYGRFGFIGALMLESWEELKEAGEIDQELHLHWGGLWRNRNPIKLGWDLAHFEIRKLPQISRL